MTEMILRRGNARAAQLCAICRRSRLSTPRARKLKNDATTPAQGTGNGAEIRNERPARPRGGAHPGAGRGACGGLCRRLSDRHRPLCRARSAPLLAPHRRRCHGCGPRLRTGRDRLRRAADPGAGARRDAGGCGRGDGDRQPYSGRPQRAQILPADRRDFQGGRGGDFGGSVHLGRVQRRGGPACHSPRCRGGICGALWCGLWRRCARGAAARAL
ncbi:hypothetical protein SAMN05877831_10473 [Rhodobacter maris]|uniref:Uncharacterized protein n=1 Tax=Rhodobacter maris TaxID=446682 RepID=A0A285SGD5_9RHOB|nr:hypothetical protein SAMN05877831_10473 [Rhodobacter maris]